MTDKEIKKFKDKVESLKDTKKYLLDLQEKIREYEENTIVKEYLALLEQLETDKEYSYWGIQDLDEKQIFERAINEIKINKSNNIYVYLSSYIKVNRRKKKKADDLIVADLPVAYNSLNADYRKYRNIELKEDDPNYEVDVPVHKCEKFERDNIVLHAVSKNGADYYDYVRNMYFEDIYNYGEEKALEKVKYMRNLQKPIRRNNI